MKREYLESLGIDKEVIDSIMAEHGKTVQSIKSDLEESKAVVEDLQSQLQQRDADLASLKEKGASVEQLQQQVADLEGKYAIQQEEHKAAVSNIRKQSEIKLGVTQAGAKNIKAVIALLEPDKIELTEKGVQGLSEQIEALKESDPYMFAMVNEPSKQAVKGGNPEQNRKSGESNAFQRAVDKFTKY